MKVTLNSPNEKLWHHLILVLVFSCTASACTYMKMNPAPDADKAFAAGNNSCYLATAANMLAGAGYGDGASVQARTDDIYGDLTAQFGTANGGWTDTALTWWLASANNTWPNNPYTVVTVRGNKSPRFPWANANGAREISNELRSCNFVGLSISWPTNATNGGVPVVGTGGHAITDWGDNSRNLFKGYSTPLTGNSTRVRVTDSDTDAGGDVQVYRYDGYTNPNPGGANEGNGWYFDYSANHPYIKHIIVLSPVQTTSGTGIPQRVFGSYRIHQGNKVSATDLHYTVGTDTDILSYVTTVTWITDNPPVVVESQPRRTSLDVDWDFSERPVPDSSWVTISTEFILNMWNAIEYDNVHFTYPEGVVGVTLPEIGWSIKSADVVNADTIRNVTGGYVVGSFDIVDTTLLPNENMIGAYRFSHQYSFTQSPETHTLTLRGSEGFAVTNLRVGHTYGLLTEEALWEYEDWMTDFENRSFDLRGTPTDVDIDWRGRLPYPEGEDIENRQTDINVGLRAIPNR